MVFRRRFGQSIAGVAFHDISVAIGVHGTDLVDCTPVDRAGMYR